jgi:hypothetical protein
MSKGAKNKPNWKGIVDRQGLDPDSKIILLAILRRSDKDGWAKLSFDDLKAMTGIKSTSTISDRIKKLVDNLLLDKIGEGHRNKNRYRIHPGLFPITGWKKLPFFTETSGIGSPQSNSKG